MFTQLVHFLNEEIVCAFSTYKIPSFFPNEHTRVMLHIKPTRRESPRVVFLYTIRVIRKGKISLVYWMSLHGKQLEHFLFTHFGLVAVGKWTFQLESISFSKLYIFCKNITNNGHRNWFASSAKHIFKLFIPTRQCLTCLQFIQDLLYSSQTFFAYKPLNLNFLPTLSMIHLSYRNSQRLPNFTKRGCKTPFKMRAFPYLIWHKGGI